MAYKKNPLKLADGTPIHVNLLTTLTLMWETCVVKIIRIHIKQLRGLREYIDTIEIYSPKYGYFYCTPSMLSKANKEQRKQYYNELSKLNK